MRNANLELSVAWNTDFSFADMRNAKLSYISVYDNVNFDNVSMDGSFSVLKFKGEPADDIGYEGLYRLKKVKFSNTPIFARYNK